MTLPVWMLRLLGWKSIARWLTSMTPDYAEPIVRNLVATATPAEMDRWAEDCRKLVPLCETHDGPAIARQVSEMLGRARF
jgi:hypothetical protein